MEHLQDRVAALEMMLAGAPRSWDLAPRSDTEVSDGVQACGYENFSSTLANVVIAQFLETRLQCLEDRVNRQEERLSEENSTIMEYLSQLMKTQHLQSETGELQEKRFKNIEKLVNVSRCYEKGTCVLRELLDRNMKGRYLHKATLWHRYQMQ